MADYKDGIAIIVNSLHVPGKKEELQDSFLSGRRGIEKYCRFFYTEYKGHAVQLTTEAIAQGYKTIVAAGGDGTVNEVARNLITLDLNFGVLPLGSGNGLARHIKIPTDRKKAFDIICQGNTRIIDTASVNGIPFINIAGTGFDARIADLYAKSGQHGFLAYMRIVMKEYLEYTPRMFTLHLDGKRIDRQAIFISFANSSQFGYNTMIAPEASIDDGMLDVIVVKQIPILELPNIIRLLLSREINKSGYIETYRTATIEVDRDRGSMVNIDGEAVRMKRILRINVQPLSLRIIAP